MIYSKSGFVFAIATVIGLTGCVTTPPAVAPAPDPATVALDQALIRTDPPKPIGPETRVALPVYGPKTTVSFMGDASTLLGNAAKGRGPEWKFEVVGPQPYLPIYVQVSVKDVTFVDFLRGVAEQLGQRADIELGEKRITLRYRSNG